MGFFLRFTSEDQHAEMRCFVFSQFSTQTRPFILVIPSLPSYFQIKARKDIRSVFLEWFRQVYDVFIDMTTKRFSPFQLTNLCNAAYEMSQNIVSDPESSVLLTFSLPSVIDGIRKLHVSIPIDDLRKMSEASPLSLVDIALTHLNSALTIDPDILTLEQFSLSNLIVTRNGRLKFVANSSLNDLLLLFSPVFNKQNKHSQHLHSSPPRSDGTWLSRDQLHRG